MANDTALVERIVAEPMLGRIFFENLGLEELSLEDVEQNPLMLTTGHYHFVLFNVLRKAGEAFGQHIDIPEKFSRGNDAFVHVFRRFTSALKASALLFAEYERVTGMGNGDMPQNYLQIFREQYHDMLTQAFALFREIEINYRDPAESSADSFSDNELVDISETAGMYAGMHSFLETMLEAE